MINKTIYCQQQQLRSERLFELVCDLEACPYCENQPFIGHSARRRFCYAPAREAYICRQRVTLALAKKREPGRPGRERGEGAALERGYFCLLQLEGDTAQHFRFVAFANEQARLEWIEEQDSPHLLALLQSDRLCPKSLVEKLERSFPMRSGRRCLSEASLKLATSMIEEHQEAFSPVSEGESL